ncbi:MAG: RnfH family protein [Hyphomicrobiaceae bacterium]|nr:RnfH family protein [Hyphomicrobiaceae bacterium]
MNVGIAFAKPAGQVWMKLEVPDGSTVLDVIKHSGILKQFPEIDLDINKVGIFGQITKLDKVVAEGSRIEIYRPITADPELLESQN